MGEEIRERLIEEVRIRPHIWNTKLKGFKDIKLKENSWMQIANLLNISVEECQRSFKSLRTMYAKYLSDCRTGVASPIEVKQEYFQSMSFLNEFIKPRRILNHSHSGASTNGEITFEDDAPIEMSTDIIVDASNTPTPSELSEYANHTPTSRKKRKSELALAPPEGIESLITTPASLNVSEHDDEYDVFGKLVAMKLRRIHPDISDEIIYQIETSLYSGLQYKPSTGRANF